MASIKAIIMPKWGLEMVEGTLAKDKAVGKRTWSKPGKDPIVHAFTGAPKR